MYYNLININGLRPRHGNEKRSTHDSDRSCEEGSVRKAVRGAGPDALTGRAAIDPRLPRSAWRQLPDQKRNWRASAPENRLRGVGKLTAAGQVCGVDPVNLHDILRDPHLRSYASCAAMPPTLTR